LGNPSEVPKLNYLIQYYNQEAIFLRKTLIHANKIEGFCYLSGFRNCFDFDKEDRGWFGIILA